MTSTVNRWLWGASPAQNKQDVELDVRERKTIPLPRAGEIPPDKDIQAVHVTSKQQLLLLLQKLNENPEIKAQLLAQCNENDEVSHIAKELLNEDLTASTLIIANDEEGAKWLEQKKATWYPDAQPEPTWRYHHVVTKPARAIWWTGQTVYQVWKVATTIMVPLGVAVTVIQSPWTNVLLYFLKKII